MILQSATSARFYEIYVKNHGLVSLKRVYVQPDQVTPFRDRTLINDERTKAFTFAIKDTDLSNPLIVLKQHENIHIGRAYAILQSPNGREWELTCRGDGLYKIKGLTIDWPRAQAPILADPSGVRWRLEVNNGGELLATSDPAALEYRPIALTTQDGTLAYEITVDVNGLLTVTDTALSNALYSEAELVAPDGTRWLLRVDNDGVLYLSDEWQATRSTDEWPVVLATGWGLLYVVDARFGPPISGYGYRRGWRAA